MGLYTDDGVSMGSERTRAQLGVCCPGREHEDLCRSKYVCLRSVCAAGRYGRGVPCRCACTLLCVNLRRTHLECGYFENVGTVGFAHEEVDCCVCMRAWGLEVRGRGWRCAGSLLAGGGVCWQRACPGGPLNMCAQLTSVSGIWQVL